MTRTTFRQIPAVRGVDPAVAKILEPIRENLLTLTRGNTRAVRLSELAGSVVRVVDGGLQPIVVPSVMPQIERRIEEMQSVQTDLSTLAHELLETARFGSILAASAADSKTLTVNVNGHVAGYGVAVWGGEGEPTESAFIIQADKFAVVFPSPPWLPNEAYALGQYVTPTEVSQNLIYEVTTAGVTGETEPEWPDTPGHTVESGTVTFTARTIDERVPFLVGNVGGITTVGIDGNLLVDGTIEAVAIAAGSITADKVAAGAIQAEHIATNLLLTQAIEIAAPGYLRSGQAAWDAGVGWFWGFLGSIPVMSIGDSTGNKLTWDGNVLRVVGEISGAIDAGSIVGPLPSTAFDISAAGWTIDSTFSAVDSDTVAWTAGTLHSAAGQSFAISAGDTGDMAARTYIYFDVSVSETELLTTTTAGNAVGPGRILVAVAENATPLAFFQVFGGSGSFAPSIDIPSFGPLKNGDFETGTTLGWEPNISWSVEPGSIITGNYVARIASSTTGLRSNSFPAGEGQRFLVTCVAERDESSLPDADLSVALRWDSSPDEAPFFSDGATADRSIAGPQFLRFVATVPEGTTVPKTGARVVARKHEGTAGHWFVDDFFVTPMIADTDIGTIDLGSQVSGILTEAFAAVGLINENVTINPDGTLSGAGGGQAFLNQLPGAIDLATQVSGALTEAFAAAGLINENVTINPDGTLTGAGGGQVLLPNLPGAIAAGQIAVNTITGGMIAALTITGGHIAGNTITGANIQGGTITGDKIGANQITGAQIAALTITAANIAGTTITGDKIAALTINGAHINGSVITGSHITGLTITGSHIAGSTITGAKIAADTITGDKIVGSTITGAKIAADTITGNHIIANAITANHLASSLIYAGSIRIDTGGHVRSNSMTAFDTGTGFFLGYSGATPVFSVGNSAGNKMTWNGSVLEVVGNLNFTNSLETFNPTWSGFSVNPSGQIGYIDFGAYVILISLLTSDGVSNSGAMLITNFPSALRPSRPTFAETVVKNGTLLRPGQVNIPSAGNTLQFSVYTASTVTGGISAGVHESSGAKSWPQGSMLIYAK